MPLIKSFQIATLFMLLPALSLADMVVTYYEPVEQLHVSKTDKDSQSFSTKSLSSALTHLRFTALGQQFELLLEDNERVATGFEPAGGDPEIQILRGQVRNKPGSWARIVLFNGLPSGVFSDGIELFAIEAPGDSALQIDGPVVYRLADAHIAPGTMSCAADDLSGRASDVAKVIGNSNKTALARGPGALSDITMSSIGDFEFTTLRGGELAAAVAIATRMNIIDGFFSEQVGVQITLAQPVETHSDADDPFTETIDSGTLLDELSEYRLQTASHNSAGLTHLWTGRELTGSTVGIAWRGALCDEYFGAGLSEGNGGALIDSLIAAHEIGHNFGAQHDGEPGTSCPDATGDYIMSASVNGSQQFSNCSIAIMQAEAAAAACVVALPAVDVSIEPDVDFSLLLLGVPADLEYRVSSNGTLEAANVQADFVLPTNLSLDGIAASAGSCSGGAGLASCSLGTLAGLGDETVTISVTPVAVGSGAAIATISTSGDDERAGNNQDVSNYTIQAPVDLVARMPVAPDVIVDASTTVTANVDNISGIDATSVTAGIVLENGIRAVSANWSIGSCTVTAQQVSCQANTLAAMSSSTLTIAVNATLRGRREVTVTLGSAEPDATPQDNTITGEVVVVVERRNDNDGGGSTSPLLLLFGLGSVFLVRRRQVTGLGKIAD